MAIPEPSSFQRREEFQEMSAGDKHLDAEWKRIQKKTFTRWCNEHLRNQNMVINDLSDDFADGVELIVLIQVLSQKKLGRYNKKPRIYAQKMENVQLALDFLTKKERIRLVNIGSGDIVNNNLKLILGLIWTLILHYQISIGFGIEDDGKGGHSGLTPKQALLAYLQGLVPERKIKNLTTDWNDGTLVAAVVDGIAPGLCPDHAEMDPQNALENASHAMKLAEDWLGVPMVLDAKDMVNPNVDELSMMTYLSQFPEAKLKPGAPIKSRANLSKVKVYGPGVEEGGGLDTNAPSTEFTVDPREAGVIGKPTINVSSPDGPIECTCEDNKDGTYSCGYIPTVPGDYVVNVSYGGKPAGKSPYKVNIAPGADAGACVAYGPGIEGGDLRAGSPTEFWVETKDAGEGKLGITVRGPRGPINAEDLKVTTEAEGKYNVEYTPQNAGPHTVEVTFSGLHIPQSPFKVRVGADKADASKCRAEGPGLEEKGVEINQQTWFDVHTKGAGKGDLNVHIKGPHGTVDSQQSEPEKGVHHYSYMPSDAGEHVVTIKYGGSQIPNSRFKVQVEPPTDPSKCVAYGPGLSPQGVRVNEPAKFTVKTKDAGHGDVDVKIVGPCGEIPFEVETSPYTHNYTYQASEPGQYTVDIKFADQHIPKSPYKVAITDAAKVQISGPGLNGECLPVGDPLVYQVDARGAGPGELKCTVQDASLVKTEDTDEQGPVVTANGDGTFQIEYTPVEPGLKKMNVTFGEAAIPSTPVRLNLFDASKVKAYGPGLEDGNKSGEQTHFIVDMREAGEGELSVAVKGPVNTPVQIKDQANGMVRCEYLPTEAGDYQVDITYGGTHIPDSPYSVHVRPSTDPSKVNAYGPGLEPGLTTDMWAEFFVDYKEAGDGEPAVEVHGPAGGENLEEEQVEEGLKKYRYFIDPEEAGEYTIKVDFSDEPIPGSPFKVQAKWKTDPSRVKAYGPGLEGGISGEWTDFTVDMSQAGEGGLELQVEGPCEAEVRVIDNEDKTATVRYNPAEPGPYNIGILFAGQPIPGSTFTAMFDPPTDASKVKAYGPGLEPNGVKVGDPGDFTIDTQEAGAGAVDVAIDGPFWHGRAPTPISPAISPGGNIIRTGSIRRPKGAAAKPQITSNNDNTYAVQYNPRKVGTYHINVFFADDTIPDSPYKVNVSDPTKVRVNGAGVREDVSVEEEGPAILSIQEPLEWSVDCTEAGPGQLEATLHSPSGDINKDLQVEEVAEDVYKLTASQPDKAGRYRLCLKYSDKDVKQSPIELSLSDASKVKVTGPGLSGGRASEPLIINIDSQEAGEGGLSLALSGPEHVEIACEDNKDGTVTLSFAPETAGEYKLDIKFGGEDVPGSEFCIPVTDPSKATAYGSGVTGKGARVGAPAQVIVDIRDAGPVSSTAEVTTPSGEKSNIELHPTEEDPEIFVGEYTPEEAGYYGLEVKCDKEELPKSPFTVPICDPSAVSLAGPGLEAAAKDVDNVIDVYTAGAGPGEIECQFTNPDGSPAPVDSFVARESDDHYQLHYTPHEAGPLEAQVTYAGFPVGGRNGISVADASLVKVEGPGVESGVLAKKETEFTVDATEAGPGEPSVEVLDQNGKPIATSVAEISPQKWLVKYTPEEAGPHTVNIKYNGQEVEGSPFFVDVCDPAAVRAYGPGLERAVTKEPAHFTVDASEAGSGALGLQITGPADCDINCKEVSPGKYEVSYIAPRPGVYNVEVKFADKEVDGSPFKVKCSRPPPDASKCVITGLETPGSLTVDCQDAGGTGMLEVGVCGAYVPVEFVSVKHNGDYTFSVTYDIPEPGETQISVKWHDQHLTGSPFTVVTQ